MNHRGIAAVVVTAGLVLAGCGARAASDKSGCLLVQSRYSAMVAVMDRWAYGNATNPEMLDVLDDLRSGADYQQDAASTAEFKAVAADLGTATRQVYRAVNTGVGFEPAANQLAGASRALNKVCDKWT